MSDLAKIPAVMIWAAAVILIVLIFFLLSFIFFQRPICEWLRRAGGLKLSSPKLGAVEVGSLSQDSLASSVKATQTAEPPAETLVIGDKEANDAKTPDVFDRLWVAFDERNLDRMAELRDKYVDSGKDPDEKTGNANFYLALRSVAGDAGAMQELKRLGDSGSHYASQARRLMAFALSEMDQPALAQDAYHSALAVAETDKEKVKATIGLARQIEKSGQWEESTKMLVDTLGRIWETAPRVDLLDALAETAKRHEQNFLAVIALEESVTLDPEDTSRLFELGYRSGKAGLPGLSAVAYKQLLAIAPKHENGLNNLGVEFKQLNLSALAVQRYEEASKLGNTLADANLGDMLIDAGFLSAARDRLTIASRAKEVHENVHSALARIDTKQKAEEETLQKVLENARTSADQLVKFSQTLFSDHGNGKIEGSWSEPGEVPFQLEVVGGSITGQCAVDKHQWNIAGRADFAGGGHVDVTQTDGYSHPHLNGYLCLEPDGSGMRFILSDSKGELIFWRFTRVPPPTT